MPKSTQLVIVAALMSGIFVGVIWYFLPGIHWGVYLVVCLLLAGATQSRMLHDEANRKIVDRR
ncbi:hypothetical protein [Hyphomicrobium sp.]|uniref:hypothetical protein n=1 Tax=Hyphomicrobium sp. TaxID=82 RepID=UPI001DBE158E|nr:hypothetical protein [Hyphomicrobium sp.]MBY0558772.1 hypothetical protein [Hyphomicrobium sp.]